MSTLAIGNKTQAVKTPLSPWLSVTQAHNQNTGPDGFLLVASVMDNGELYTGCTYGGQSMTLIATQNFGGLTQRLAFYGLLNPPTGTNDIILSFNIAQFNPVSIFATSFTGCGGAGNFATNGASATPNSKTLTVTAGS